MLLEYLQIKNHSEHKGDSAWLRSPGQVCSCLLTKISVYQIPASLQLPGTVLGGINVSLGAEHTASHDDLQGTETGSPVASLELTM